MVIYRLNILGNKMSVLLTDIELTQKIVLQGRMLSSISATAAEYTFYMFVCIRSYIFRSPRARMRHKSNFACGMKQIMT